MSNARQISAIKYFKKFNMRKYAQSRTEPTPAPILFQLELKGEVVKSISQSTKDILFAILPVQLIKSFFKQKHLITASPM